MLEKEIHEAISKWLTYHTVEPSEEIFIPIFMDNRFKLIPFQPILVNLAGGTVAYLLKPIENPEVSPIFTFRGTALKTCSGSLVADMGIRAWAEAFFSWELTPGLRAGASIIANNRDKISRLMINLTANPVFIGHSLGATVALEFAALFGARTKAAYGFNSPGISRKAKRAYKKLTTPFEAIAFSTVGDPIKIFAQGRTLDREIRVTPGNSPLSTSQKHSTCVLSSAQELAEIKQKSTAKKVAIFIAKLIIAIPYRALFLLFGLISLGVELYHLSGIGDTFKVCHKIASDAYKFTQGTELEKTILAAHYYTKIIRPKQDA